MSEPSLTLPTIHLNGTSRQSLSEAYERAYSALREAYDAVNESYPNGRDYYPQGNDAINRAMAEHRARLLKLFDVREEMETLWHHCIHI